MQISLEGKTKDQIAIERIQTFEPPEGYYVAFSGGKDSITVLDLVRRSGVKYDYHYSQTGIDPPELVYFIRKYYPDVKIEKPKESIFNAIARKGLPTRLARWCCELLKEHGGEGRFCITGIRAEESIKRARRSMVQNCIKGKGKRFLHPIIDWYETDIWGYIKEYKLPYCELYDKGWKRIGCIGCPMSTHREFEFKQYPKIKEAWYRASTRAFNNKNTSKFHNTEEYWNWWLQDKTIDDFRASIDNPMFI